MDRRIAERGGGRNDYMVKGEKSKGQKTQKESPQQKKNIKEERKS